MSAVRVQVGGFCIKGGGHSWTYGEGEGADGCDGWEMYIDVDPEDVHLFPEWVQECYRWATDELGRSRDDAGSAGPEKPDSSFSISGRADRHSNTCAIFIRGHCDCGAQRQTNLGRDCKQSTEVDDDEPATAPNEVPRPRVIAHCRICGVRWQDVQDNVVIVSRRGMAHHSDHESTACGMDATGPGWWWPL